MHKMNVYLVHPDTMCMHVKSEFDISNFPFINTEEISNFKSVTFPKIHLNVMSGHFNISKSTRSFKAGLKITMRRTDNDLQL